MGSQAQFQRFAALPLEGAERVQRQHSLALLESLDQQTRAIEDELERRARRDARVIRVRSHPGVGLLTASAVVHTLEPVTRFDRARRIAVYAGLDPAEHSSDEAPRFGHISKQGNRLLGFLLIEAAHTAIRDDEDLRRFYFHLLAKKKSFHRHRGGGPANSCCGSTACGESTSITTSSGAEVETRDVPESARVRRHHHELLSDGAVRLSGLPPGRAQPSSGAACCARIDEGSRPGLPAR